MENKTEPLRSWAWACSLNSHFHWGKVFSVFQNILRDHCTNMWTKKVPLIETMCFFCSKCCALFTWAILLDGYTGLFARLAVQRYRKQLNSESLLVVWKLDKPHDSAEHRPAASPIVPLAVSTARISSKTFMKKRHFFFWFKKTLLTLQKLISTVVEKLCGLLQKSLQHSNTNLYQSQRCCSLQRAVLPRLHPAMSLGGDAGWGSLGCPSGNARGAVVVWLIPALPQQSATPQTLPALQNWSMLLLCLWLQTDDLLQ